MPDNLSVTAADGASASGATYTWSLGSLAAGASGSKTLTVKAAADAPANEVLTHFASLEGSASNLAADATDTTVIGSVEAAGDLGECTEPTDDRRYLYGHSGGHQQR